MTHPIPNQRNYQRHNTKYLNPSGLHDSTQQLNVNLLKLTLHHIFCTETVSILHIFTLTHVSQSRISTFFPSAILLQFYTTISLQIKRFSDIVSSPNSTHPLPMLFTPKNYFARVTPSYQDNNNIYQTKESDYVTVYSSLCNQLMVLKTS